MSSPRFQLQILLVSLAAVLLEVSYTRIFSYKLVYYFTYVVIGLALLGLGAAGITLALSRRLREAPREQLVGGAALGLALTILLGYPVLALLQVNAFDVALEFGRGAYRAGAGDAAKLLVIALVLFVQFFAAGIAITVILSTQPAHVNRLYFADLLGAGIACAMAVPLMATISPPGCVMLAGAAAGAAAWRGPLPRLRPLAGALVLVLAALAIWPRLLPDPVVDRVKTMAPQDPPHNVVFSRWSPVFRVDVLEPTPEFAQGQSFKLIVHDGMWGSVIRGHDGDVGSLGRYDADARSLPFAVLGPAPRVMIIGAAGGNEILASLRFDAREITAVELNPVTVSLLTDHFAEFSGHLDREPRVRLVTAEGRSYLMQHEEPVDLVWFVAPDSYAAMNAATAGAYVLSESYLYTVEMIEQSLRRLAPGGVLCIQFGEIDFEGKPNRSARYLASVRAAFGRLGVTDPSRHVLVATQAGFAFVASTIIVRRDPFTAADASHFDAAVARLERAQTRYAPGIAGADERLRTILESDEETLTRFFDAHPWDIRPVYDDAPFFWHFVSFRTALETTMSADGLGIFEDGLGEQLLVVFLLLAVVLAVVLMLLPLLVRHRRWRRMPHKVLAGTYFAALGLGFMFFEVTLIQHLTLFLGYPTYSLTVTLCALLVATGVGSLWSEQAARRPARLLPWLLGALALLVVFYRLGLPAVTHAWIGAPLAARVVLTLVMLTPLGLVLGTFMPLGLRTVAGLVEEPEDYVAWAWAVNGFFSVVSSVLATMLAMTFGFDAVLTVALAIYAIGTGALLALPRPAS